MTSSGSRARNRLRESSGKAGEAYVTREEALKLLQVKSATLYTYVSRGWIRRIPGPLRNQNVYLREDVAAVRARSNARASGGIVAGGAMRYGEPIVPTSVTEITPSGPRYRGRSAVELAEAELRFEVAAELLWTGRLLEFRPWASAVMPVPVRKVTGELARCKTMIDLHDAFALVTLAAGMGRDHTHKRATGGVTPVPAARELILLLSGCFGFLARRPAYRTARAGESVAVAIADSLGAARAPGVVRALDAALVLSADHELNPATFVARVAASSESDLHRCVAAAICTNAGDRIAHGCDRFERLLRDRTALDAMMSAASAGPARSELTARFGFGHPLYPQGDPRGHCLLQIIGRMGGRSTRMRELLQFIDLMQRRHKQQPRFELSLALLTTALKLPAGSAGGIYTLGRIAGWIAHVSEQRLAGFLIRPRARFTSVPSDGS